MTEIENCYDSIKREPELLHFIKDDMYEAAKKKVEEKNALFKCFEKENKGWLKKFLATMLADLSEECIIPYFLDVVELDENLRERSWAGANLVKLKFPYIQGILISLLQKNQIDKKNLAWELFEINTSFSRNIIDALITMDSEFAEKIHFYRDREQRQKEFPLKQFYSRAEQMYEGINCGAFHYDLGYEMQHIALESEYECEAAFEILEKETNLDKKHVLAKALLKVDFERALGYLIYLVEDTDYDCEKLAKLLMELNHPKAVDAIKKVSFSLEYSNYYVNYFLDNFLTIQTPVAKKVIEYLNDQNPEWRAIMKKYQEIKQ